MLQLMIYQLQKSLKRIFHLLTQISLTNIILSILTVIICLIYIVYFLRITPDQSLKRFFQSCLKLESKEKFTLENRKLNTNGITRLDHFINLHMLVEDFFQSMRRLRLNQDLKFGLMVEQQITIKSFAMQRSLIAQQLAVSRVIVLQQ